MSDSTLLPLSPHLSLLEGEDRGRFPRAHCFYVHDEVNARFDSGCGIDRLRAFAERHPVDLVISSHVHPDHCAGNSLFPDVPLFAPVEGEQSHGRLEALSLRFTDGGYVAETWKSFIREMMGFRDRAPTDLFTDAHVFDFGATRLRAVRLEGHTADHYGFLDEHHGVLLGFDIDLTRFGPWYGHRESSLPAFRAATDRVRSLAPRRVASSHIPARWRREPTRCRPGPPRLDSSTGDGRRASMPGMTGPCPVPTTITGPAPWRSPATCSAPPVASATSPAAR